MKDCDKNKESSYIRYCDLNKLYGCAMSQKLPVNILNESKLLLSFMKVFIKNYNKGSEEGYFLEADVQYPEKFYKLYKDFPFFSEMMKIEKVQKLVTNLYDKTEYVIHMIN